MIMCPYCLTMQEPLQTNLCNNAKCGRKLPPRYVEGARSGHLTCLGTFGLTNHGKTAFLSSLMQSALAVHKIVPGSFIRTLDDTTQKTLNDWSKRYGGGAVQLPSTPRNDEQHQPLLVMNNKFATKQPDVLVAYDLAGEVVDLAGSQPEYVRALNKVNTIWFVVSLDDLVNKNDAGYSLDGLFNVYMDAMADLHLSIKGRNILVVYTKADVLVGVRPGLEPLPWEVEEYLGNDPYDQLRKKRGADLPPFDEDAYYSKMHEISDILQEYTVDYVDGGGAFVSMVQDAGAQVYFTMNSAYGNELDTNHSDLGIEVHAIRVLDALIWAIKLNRSIETAQEVALIVPATVEASGLASQDSILRFYDELSAHGGHVATWYPGKVDPAFPLGISPSGVQTTHNLALIGPILDRLKPGTAVVLLVNQALPMDLDDLYKSQWMDRLLLVVARRELVVTWLPHCSVFAHDGEIAQMVGSFIEQLTVARTKRP